MFHGSGKSRFNCDPILGLDTVSKHLPSVNGMEKKQTDHMSAFFVQQQILLASG